MYKLTAYLLIVNLSTILTFGVTTGSETSQNAVDSPEKSTGITAEELSSIMDSIPGYTERQKREAEKRKQEGTYSYDSLVKKVLQLFEIQSEQSLIQAHELIDQAIAAGYPSYNIPDLHVAKIMGFMLQDRPEAGKSYLISHRSHFKEDYYNLALEHFNQDIAVNQQAIIAKAEARVEAERSQRRLSAIRNFRFTARDPSVPSYPYFGQPKGEFEALKRRHDEWEQQMANVYYQDRAKIRKLVLSIGGDWEMKADETIYFSCEHSDEIHPIFDQLDARNETRDRAINASIEKWNEKIASIDRRNQSSRDFQNNMNQVLQQSQVPTYSQPTQFPTYSQPTQQVIGPRGNKFQGLR